METVWFRFLKTRIDLKEMMSSISCGRMHSRSVGNSPLKMAAYLTSGGFLFVQNSQVPIVQIDFGVVCASAISEPAGDWVFTLGDTYGDGWQGGFISVVVDGAEFAQVKIPNGGGSAGAATVTVPPTATTLKFVWSDDDYDSECVFTIKSPKGNVVASVSNPTAGDIKLNLCLE